MKINTVPYDENTSESLLNISYLEGGSLDMLSKISEKSNWFGFKYFELMKNIDEGNRNSKYIFKEVFGDQQTCKNYTNRNWIWTFSTDDEMNTAYVLISVTGLSWEFDTNSKDYQKIIDVRLQIEEEIFNYFQINKDK